MSKEKEKKRNVLKSRFFLKLFAIPSICFLLLELWAKTIPNEDGTFTTWAETLQETFIVIITWFILSIIIALIIRKKNKGKNKEEKNTNIIKNNFFLKLFIFPSICWLQLELWLKNTPKDDGTLTTWPELFREVFVITVVCDFVVFTVWQIRGYKELLVSQNITAPYNHNMKCKIVVILALVKSVSNSLYYRLNCLVTHLPPPFLCRETC